MWRVSLSPDLYEAQSLFTCRASATSAFLARFDAVYQDSTDQAMLGNTCYNRACWKLRAWPIIRGVPRPGWRLSGAIQSFCGLLLAYPFVVYFSCPKHVVLIFGLLSVICSMHACYVLIVASSCTLLRSVETIFFTACGDRCARSPVLTLRRYMRFIGSPILLHASRVCERF